MWPKQMHERPHLFHSLAQLCTSLAPVEGMGVGDGHDAHRGILCRAKERTRRTQRTQCVLLQGNVGGDLPVECRLQNGLHSTGGL